MAITEANRLEMYLELRKVLGDEKADTLMEHLPPVGWANVARQDDMMARFDAVAVRFENVNVRFDAMEMRFSALETRFEVIDQRFAVIDQRLNALENRVDELKADMNRHFQNLDLRLSRMTSTFVAVQVALFTAMFGVLLVR